jgi:hypothetical protein
MVFFQALVTICGYHCLVNFLEAFTSSGESRNKVA